MTRTENLMKRLGIVTLAEFNSKLRPLRFMAL